MSSTTHTNVSTHSLGYPRIGANRELKKATEAFWKGNLSEAELLRIGKDLRLTHWQKQRDSGLDLVPCNDFSFYDQVLDLTCMVGNVPPRFGWKGDSVDLETRFLIARGQRGGSEGEDGADQKDCQTAKVSTFASEMTKWFDTNYHYIVPEFRQDTRFKLASCKVMDEFLEAKENGIPAKPVLLGPVTYLSLGKVQDSLHPDFDRFSLFDDLLAVYVEVLKRLQDAGAEWVQIDEPILALDLDPRQQDLLRKSTAAYAEEAPGLKILLASYFGPLGDHLDLACSLPCHGLHLDAVRAKQEVSRVAENLPKDRVLSLGLVDGRNIWKNDYFHSLSLLHVVRKIRGEGSPLWLAPSCSLLHVPVTLANEPKLDGEIKNWLAFADEKLVELQHLKDLALHQEAPGLLEENEMAHISRRKSPRIHRVDVRTRLESVTPKMLNRESAFTRRQALQRAKLNLPAFPTTTIGSFPQTQAVRAARAKWRKGGVTDSEYDAFLKAETRRCIQIQEEIGIDMPVHGEFERNDMVEYFGEQLDGFVFTENGWVQSYGTRCVKPPVIYGDVSRPKPMTTYWSEYAQSQTKRPMKGMLTGPVTLLQWSFVRNDQPRHLTARQIALAIRDEVVDLEVSGIAAIQIDEPAFREGLPLRKTEWAAYLEWAVEAFRLCACGVRDDTQIHTHMCYSEFNDIIESIAAMDADVITIETSRSNMELLDAFVAFRYPAEIGPGVYDIHSPRVPKVNEMTHLMAKACDVLPKESLWVNPDCGLKTRQWEEVIPSLKNMVETAQILRSQHAETQVAS